MLLAVAWSCLLPCSLLPGAHTRGGRREGGRRAGAGVGGRVHSGGGRGEATRYTQAKTIRGRQHLFFQMHAWPGLDARPWPRAAVCGMWCVVWRGVVCPGQVLASVPCRTGTHTQRSQALPRPQGHLPETASVVEENEEEGRRGMGVGRRGQRHTHQKPPTLRHTHPHTKKQQAQTNQHAKTKGRLLPALAMTFLGAGQKCPLFSHAGVFSRSQISQGAGEGPKAIQSGVQSSGKTHSV